MLRLLISDYNLANTGFQAMTIEISLLPVWRYYIILLQSIIFLLIVPAYSIF